MAKKEEKQVTVNLGQIIKVIGKQPPKKKSSLVKKKKKPSD